MNSEVVTLTVFQVLLAYIFVVIVLFFIKRRGINREKELILATFRMTVQLVIVGYLLTLIFENPHPLITFGIIFLMVWFAVFTIFKKFSKQLNWRLRRVIIFSMFVGTVPLILYFIWVVIRVSPYYHPQYVIPISGMIIGNSMTGISLGVHTLLTRFTNGIKEIEEALILGATPKEASESITKDAFDAAILPTLNSMLGMGIIFLPGMMTGQILAGVTPSLAIAYQIVIMLGILGGVSITSYTFISLGRHTFFNKKKQLT